MTHFTGICTFPHGGLISAGLLLATCAGLAATTYAVASCRMVVLSFVSDSGNFEQTFSRFNEVETANAQQYKVALGLFQWLRPTTESSNWDEGICVGYQQTMRDEFSGQYFEMARGFGSMAVLLSFIIVLWSLVNSCVAWNTWQIIILSVLLLAAAVGSGMSFMFLKSEICNSTFVESSCAVDEGGLVLVAGTILWLAAFLITVIFVRTLDYRMGDFGLSELERARARDLSQILEKRARDKEQRRERQRQAERAPQIARLASPISYEADSGNAVVVSPSTIETDTFQDEEESRVDVDEYYPAERDVEQDTSSQQSDHHHLEQSIIDGESEAEEQIEVDAENEVYIHKRMQRIDTILRDGQSSAGSSSSSYEERGGRSEI